MIDYTLPYGQVVAEWSASDTVSYLFGMDRVSQTRNGKTSFYLADGQGSVRALTDSLGNVSDSYTYSAFGEIVARTGTTENAFTYTGESYDPNSGFYNLRARWYDPARGRFVSVDPFAGDPQSPVSLHRYLYANQSPVTMSDPSGMMTMSLAEASVTTAVVGILAATVATKYLSDLLGPVMQNAGFEISFHEVNRAVTLSLISASIVTVVGVDKVMEMIREYAETIKKQMRQNLKKEWLIAGPSNNNGATMNNWDNPVRIGPKAWYRDGGKNDGRIVGVGVWIPKRTNTYNAIMRFDNHLVDGYPESIYRYVYHFHIGDDESNHLVVGSELR